MGPSYRKKISRGKRKITRSDRKKWGKNARKGEKRWQGMSHKERVKARGDGRSWGFRGSSPHTMDITSSSPATEVPQIRREEEKREERREEGPKLRKEISLEKEEEVYDAERLGAIKLVNIGTKDEPNYQIRPMKGKAHIKEGKLYYDEKFLAKHSEEKKKGVGHRERRHKERKEKKHREEHGRKIKEEDRSVWGKNALKGTKKWSLMPHDERVRRRANPLANWGFEGKPPNTKNRR